MTEQGGEASIAISLGIQSRRRIIFHAPTQDKLAHLLLAYRVDE